MNIFILDLDHKKNAKYHCDKHIVKMISELCQILSTVIYETTGETIKASDTDEFLKIYPGRKETIEPTHSNHPCNRWVMESMDNFEWTMSLLDELHKEWIFRFGHKHDKVHASYYKLIDGYIDPILSRKGLTKFIAVVEDDCLTDDVVESYRKYYNTHKRNLFSWKNREVPHWIL